MSNIEDYVRKRSREILNEAENNHPDNQTSAVKEAHAGVVEMLNVIRAKLARTMPDAVIPMPSVAVFAQNGRLHVRIEISPSDVMSVDLPKGEFDEDDD